jgi:choice-of-anchor C domain-containing protein
MVGAALAVVASLALAGSALAAGFSNGSFETGSFVNGGSGFDTLSPGSTAITGWTVGGGGVDWISTYWNAEQGSFSLDMNATSAGSISQTFDTVAGATYSVSFWVSANPMCGAGTKTLTVSTDATGSTAGSYPAAVTTAGDVSAMTWAKAGYTFTASGTSTTLTFTGDATAGACGPALDNVTVTPVSAIGASCKDGGWATNTYVDGSGNTLTFKNQGQCVSYFATSGAVPIGN